MNKKSYQKPAMQVVTINIRHQLLSGSPVHNASTNLTGSDAINYGGGGSGPSRSRSFDDWDEDDEE